MYIPPNVEGTKGNGIEATRNLVVASFQYSSDEGEGYANASFLRVLDKTANEMASAIAEQIADAVR